MSTGTTYIQGIYGGNSKGLYSGSRGYGRGSMIYRKPPKKWPKILIAVLILILLLKPEGLLGKVEKEKV